MQRNRWIILSAALLSAAGCGRQQGAESTQLDFSTSIEVGRVVTVGRAPITETVELTGTLVPFRAATIVAEVDGVIQHIPRVEKPLEYELDGRRHSAQLHLDIGHRVRAGDVLAEIDPADFQLALNVANAQLALARNELADLKAWRRSEEVDQLQAQLAEAQAMYQRTRRDLQRYTELLQQNATPRGEYDRVETAYHAAKAVLENAQAAANIATAGPTPEQLAVAQSGVDLAEAEVRLREEKLSKCTIRAPYDAIIADRFIGEGDRVTAMPRVEIMQIMDPSILFAQIEVPERLAGRIGMNDPAVVVPNQDGDRVPGVVALINEKIDPASRAFRVRVGLDNSRGLFKPGAFCHVQLMIGSAPDALAVPAAAITFSEGNPSVWVLEQGRARRQPVTLGLKGDAAYQVDGVDEGATVIADNLALLSDGAQVEVRASDGAGRAATTGGAAAAALRRASEPVATADAAASKSPRAEGKRP